MIAAVLPIREKIENVLRHNPDLILLDCGDQHYGTETVAEIRKVRPDTKILIFASVGSVEFAVRALEAGAAGYVCTTATAEELTGAVQAVAGEETFISPKNAPKVMMLTVSEEDEHVMGALGAGAIGYVLKGVKAVELIGAVKSVLEGDAFVSPNLTKRLIANSFERSAPSLLSTLSDREERTLRLLASGLSNAEIGRELGVTERTVKAHVTNILAKLKVRNRVEATLVAEREWRTRGREKAAD